MDPRLSKVSTVVETRRADGEQKRYALLIGASAYDDPGLRRLGYCASDVRRLGQVLTRRGYHVTTLADDLDPANLPTIANVKRELPALMERADEDDILLVHFSCHGTIVDERPHLIVRDTPNTEEGIRASGLSLAALLQILRGKPRWVSIFLDACHMGMGIGLDPEVVRMSRQVQLRAGGFALLSGSTEGQMTQDSEQMASGVFTNALIEGLEGGAAEPNGRVLFSGLAQHVQRRVTAWRGSEEGRSKLAAMTPVVRMEVSDLAIFPPLPFVPLRPPPSVKITCSAYSPDGRWLATGAEDCTVQLWNPKTGERFATPAFMAHAGYVKGVAFSPDGLLLASVSNDGSTYVWQIPGFNLVTPWPENQQTLVHAIAWSPKGRAWLAASSVSVLYQETDAIGRPGYARSFDTRGLICSTWCVAFLPGGDFAIGGSDDGIVRMWRVADGACVRTFEHEGPVWALSVSKDGLTIAAAGADRRASPELVNAPRLWSVQTGEPIRKFAGHTHAVTAIAFSPENDRVATASYDGVTRIFSTSTGRLLLSLPNEHPVEASTATFSPSGDTLFVGYADGRGMLFDVASTRA